jgi:hypothetical protein
VVKESIRAYESLRMAQLLLLFSCWRASHGCAIDRLESSALTDVFKDVFIFIICLLLTS